MRRYIVFLILLPLLVAAGCREDEFAVPEIIFEEYGTFSPDGGECSIGYVINNAFEYGIMRVSSESEWVEDLTCREGRISFVLDRNREESPRTAALKVTYPECPDMVLEIIQEAYDMTGGMPIGISVEMTGNRTARAVFDPLDAEQTYYCGCTLASDVLSYGSTSEFMSSLVRQMEQEAEETGLRLNAVIQKYVTAGPAERTFSGLQPKTGYYAFAFSLDTDGTFGDNFAYEEFTSGEFDYPDATFGFRIISVSQSSADIQCEPSAGYEGISYALEIVSAEEYESVYGSDEMLMASKIAEYASLIDYYTSFGIPWSFADFTVTGTDRRQHTGLIPGTEYYVYAFGLDETGTPTAPVSKQLFSTQEVQITDDCTFEMEFSGIRPESFDVTVIPSDPATRYYVYLSDAAILESSTADEVAALLINMAEANGIDWADSPYIHSGRQTLNTVDDLEASMLESDTEYAVFVFGVNASGERTTAVGYDICRTAEVEPSDMTISIHLSGLRPNSAEAVFVPSAEDEPYFYGCVPAEEMESYSSDTGFMEAMVYEAQLNGSFKPVYGEHTLSLGGNILRPETDYVVYAFGYAGGITTGLFTGKFTTPERVFSDASVTITWTIRDGNELYEANPSVNYIFQGMAAVTFRVTPDNAESWYFSGFGNSLSYLQALDVEELLYSIQSQGMSNHNKTEVTYAAAWNSVLCGAGYGIDASGDEGYPVVVEVRVPAGPQAL